MKITVLQTGGTLVSGAVPDGSSHRWKYAYSGLFQRRSRRISVPVKCFLVEIKGHRVLIDTGWSADCVRHPIRHLGFGLWFASAPVLSEGEDVPAQLKRTGIQSSDLEAVLLTHLDCDHVSGLIPVRDARHIYCSEEEWHHAQKRDVRYNPAFWKGVHMETFSMKEDPVMPFGKSCDLFGDGSIRAVFTPGDSEGSVAVLAKGESGYAAFVGDDSYNRRSWEEQKLPGSVYNIEEMKRTLQWVRKVSGDPGCIGIYAAHDPEGPLSFLSI